jgi:hypothetical protein
MSERSGLGVVEMAILAGLDSLGARPDSAPWPDQREHHQEDTRPPFRAAAVLAALMELISHPDLPDQELI